MIWEGGGSFLLSFRMPTIFASRPEEKGGSSDPDRAVRKACTRPEGKAEVGGGAIAKEKRGKGKEGSYLLHSGKRSFEKPRGKLFPSELGEGR